MSARHPWWLPAAAFLGAALLRVLGSTWRVTVADDPEYTAGLRRGERFIYAFWHSTMLPLVVFHRDEGAAVLVSRHRDGELIARVIERLGFVAARGSSTRGGEAGVRGMLAWAERDRHLGITPDGPKGPAEEVKDGAIYLAERAARRLVPTTAAAHPVRVLATWDGFLVPWPFARVLVVHGAPFAPGPASGAASDAGATRATRAESGPVGAAVPDAAERARACFEETLRRLSREARARVGGRA